MVPHKNPRYAGFWVAPSVEADKFVLVNLKFAIKIGFVPLRNTMQALPFNRTFEAVTSPLYNHVAAW